MLAFGAAILFATPFYLVEVPSPRELLIGKTGAVLMVSTIFLVASIAFLPEPHGILRRFADLVGRVSYPVYLLHPICYTAIRYYEIPLFGWERLAAAFVTTVFLSYLVNSQIELRVASWRRPKSATR